MMLYANFLKALSQFVDWLYAISLIKKMWLLVTLMAIGLVILLKHYDTRLVSKDDFYTKKIDSITVFYTIQLENCNIEKQNGYKNIVNVLQHSLETQQKQTLEVQKLKIKADNLRLETEKLKTNR